MGYTIEVRSLVKKYGNVTAVDGITFNVEEGKLFAFLGPNGAGKSSTINCICTTTEINSGTIFIAGHEVGRENDRVRASIGVVFQESVLDNLLTVRENLETRGSFYNLGGRALRNRIEEVASAVAIKDILGRRYGKLSGGQRRRVDMARGLLHSPKILFLDEPTTGLDPQTRSRVWDTVAALQKRTGMTVFMTTHYMEEASAADDVAIIDRGKIAAQGSPEELRVQYSSDYLRVIPKDAGALGTKLQTLGLKYEIERGVFLVRQPSSMAALHTLKQTEDLIQEFEVVRGNMDDVFMAVTGHAIREGEE